MRPNSATCALTLLSLFSKRIRFAHGILTWRFYPFSDTQHHAVNNSEYCPSNEISMHYYCEAPSVDYFIIQLNPWWQRSWNQRPIGAEAASPAVKTMICTSTGNHYWTSQRHILHTINPDELKTTSMSSNGRNRPRTPEKSWLHPRMRQFTAETYRAQRVSGTQGSSLTVKTRIMSTSIPTSQLGAITSPSTYNGRSDLTPECRNIENRSRSLQTISESAQLRLQSF